MNIKNSDQDDLVEDDSDERVLVCAVCLKEYTLGEIGGISSCPACRTRIVPYWKEEVTPKLYKGELRVLTMWAARWAESAVLQSSPEAVVAFQNTLEKLHEQFPDVELTYGDMIKNLRKVFPRLDVTDGRGDSAEPIL